MAKARANCTCSECGVEFVREKVCYNRSEADKWEEWAASTSQKCPDCWKKEQEKLKAEEEARRAEERELAASTAQELELPVLSGSEKQVAWANVIRQNVLYYIEEHYPTDLGLKLRAYLLETRTKASDYIDSRNNIRKFVLSVLTEMTEAPRDIAAEKAVAEESTLAPTNKTHSGEVEIIIKKNTIYAKYIIDEDFRLLVRSLGYSWVSAAEAWCKNIGATTGTVAERAAELGNKLLNAGFAVRIADADIRTAAVNGDYEPEHRRWVTLQTSGDYKGYLSLSWEREGDLFDEAKKLPCSRWSNPYMVVPVSEYLAVEDFAASRGFRFSEAAKTAIDEYKASVTIVTPATPKKAEYADVDTADILNSSAEVIEDLKDGD